MGHPSRKQTSTKRTAPKKKAAARVGAPDPRLDPIEAAQAAGLYYASQTEVGFIRHTERDAVRITDHRGRAVTTAKHLERIETLRIPPAWEQVWICKDPRGHLQATGVDQKGRRQYIYHPLWTKLRSEAKFDRMVPFAESLHTIRERSEKDLRRRGLPKDKVVALVVTLLDSTFIRIGNDEYARKNNSFGLTTLQDDHVSFRGDKAIFTFTGKSGKEHEVTFRDKRLAGLIRQCRDIPGADLFQYYDDAGKRQDIKSNHVNEYLLDTTGVPFTAKDFRTWGGTYLAASHFSELEVETAITKRRRQASSTVKEVAGLLGNTPAVCRSSYIHPRILDDFLEGLFPERWTAAGRGRKRPELKLSDTEMAVLRYLG